MKIGIVAAIKDEADIFAKELNLILQPHIKESIHTYINNNHEIVMIVPAEDPDFKTSEGESVGRPGKVSAGIVTTLLVKEYNPDIIINAGTAAGIASQDISVGDIIVANFVANHDIHIPLAGYRDYGERKMHLSNLEIFEKIRLQFKFGTVSSAESFTSSPQEWETIIKNNVSAKEMEAAGIMQAVQILNYKKPVYIIKALTDKESQETSDEKQAVDFSENFHVAMNNLSAFLAELVILLNQS